MDYFDLALDLIAYCQREDILSTSEDDLFKQLRHITNVPDEIIRDIIQ